MVRSVPGTRTGIALGVPSAPRLRRGNVAPTSGIHSPALSGSALVPWTRLTAQQSEVVTGRSVRGGTWQDVAQLMNWVAGRGTMEVPCYSPHVEIDDAVVATFRWKLRPRYVATRYAISVRMSSSIAVSVRITVDGVDHIVFVSPRALARNVVYYVDRDAQSSTTEELSIVIAGSESMAHAALIEAISVESLPRTVIVCDDNELGVQPELFRARTKIRAGNIHDALIDRVDNLRGVTRRPGMWQFSRSLEDPWVITGPTSLFSDPLALLGPEFFRDDTSSASSFWALVKCSDGTTAGTITVDNVSQGAGVDTVTIPTGTTSWTWIQSDQSITHDCEDNTSADGRRAARWDDTTLTADRTAGTGSISIATISILG